MDIMSYLIEESIILVPALWVIGVFLKKTPFISNWIIPWILLALGILGSFFNLGIKFTSVMQGILATGAAVLGHQLLKQSIRR